MRVASVDLGTNSTRLLVADANGTLEEVVRRLVITRLGEGVDERRRLLPLPIARVRNVLSDYRRELEQLGAERTLCIATSAVRDAENGEAFLGEIEWSYGFTTRLLTGEEEAAMTLARDRRGRAGHARRRHRRRLDRASGRRHGRPRQPRRRLRAPDRALRRGRRRGAHVCARPAARGRRGTRGRRRRHRDDDRSARSRARGVRPGAHPRALDLEGGGRGADGPAGVADGRGARARSSSPAARR